MSVIVPDKLINHITDWVRFQLKTSHKDVLIVPFMGNRIESNLISYLCIHYNINHKLVLCNLEEDVYDATKFAEVTNGLVAGILNRCDISLLRAYHKYGLALADIFPLADLYYSELVELVAHVGAENTAAPPIFRAGLNYSLLEWADRENNYSKIIFNEEMPNKVKFWFRYTKPQKEIVSYLHQTEKRTRHKQIHAPVCDVRCTGFVQ